MSSNTIEEHLDRLKCKSTLQMLLLVSLGVIIATQKWCSKWLKIPFIIADVLLIANTAKDMVMSLKNRW